MKLFLDRFVATSGDAVRNTTFQTRKHQTWGKGHRARISWGIHLRVRPLRVITVTSHQVCGLVRPTGQKVEGTGRKILQVRAPVALNISVSGVLYAAIRTRSALESKITTIPKSMAQGFVGHEQPDRHRGKRVIALDVNLSRKLFPEAAW